MNPKTTIAISNIATKIITAAQMDDPSQVEAFRTTIVEACKEELVGFGPAPVAVVRVAVQPLPYASGPAKVVAKGTGGLNGYTLFSKKKRAALTTEMGEEKAKEFFVKEGGVQKYIPKEWAALSAEEQAQWNAEAKEIRDDVSEPEVESATPVKTNLWHPFQKAFPAYLAAEKIAVPFTGLATATGEKYQELKKIGAQAILDFIAKYPPQPKEKKAKKTASSSSVPVEI